MGATWMWQVCKQRWSFEESFPTSSLTSFLFLPVFASGPSLSAQRSGFWGLGLLGGGLLFKVTLQSP